MNANGFDLLNSRGYIAQSTHPKELQTLFENEQVTFYCGFDPTASSLHVGHFIQFMVMRHLQNLGHRPIVLLGGGTGMIGDPSDRTDMRRIMSIEEIDANCAAFKKQAEKYINFENNAAICLNNADWFRKLSYVEVLRDIGYFFSINRMLSAECYKNRMERGLSFTELNYMIMQSYDFLHLYRTYGCKLQIGGNDQWSNIINGVDLIRKADQGESYGMTMRLLTKSDGTKMGKTAGGAVWLDADKMSPYEFYQYWRNVDDADVVNCLSLLTFLPLEEVQELGSFVGAEINHAKERLAFEVTKLVHGEDEAKKAEVGAKALFRGAEQAGALPEAFVDRQSIKAGIGLLTLMKNVNIVSSTGEARRLIEQGGITINDKKIDDTKYIITENDFVNGQIKLRKGKKKYLLIKFK